MPADSARRSVLVALVLAGIALPAAGDDVTAREREQVRRLRQRVMQLQDEGERSRAEIEQRVGRALDALDEAKQQASAARREADRRRARLVELEKSAAESRETVRRLEAEKTAVADRLGRAEKELAALELRLRAKTEEAALAEAGRQTTGRDLTERSSQLASCEERNDALYSLGKEMLGKYNSQGLFDRALKSEPLLQLKRVKVEQEVQDYRERLEDAHPLNLRPRGPASNAN